MPEPTHDGEGLQEAIRRRRQDWRHPFERNPAARNRVGWKDLAAGHAATNIAVEWARERGLREPHRTGHLIFYAALALVALVLVAAVVVAVMVIR